MNKLLTLSLVAAVGLVANQAFAQCASCAGNAPVFSQSQSYSAPISYGAPMNYGAPVYSQSYGTPVYSQPAMSYSQPMYSQPVMPYSQPVYGQSGCSACGGTMVSQPISYGGCNGCCSGCCGGCSGGNTMYGGYDGSIIVEGSYMDGTAINGIIPGDGSVIEGSVIESGAPVDGGSGSIVSPPANSEKATPPVPTGDTKGVETPPTPDNGDDT